jgi:hypothetical protein
MALYRHVGNTVTVAPGASVFSSWSYPGATDHGPQYIDAYFVGADSNYGTITTVQTSTTAFYTDQYGYYWPMGVSYSAVLRNDGTTAVVMSVNIGTFE